VAEGGQAAGKGETMKCYCGEDIPPKRGQPSTSVVRRPAAPVRVHNCSCGRVYVSEQITHQLEDGEYAVSTAWRCVIGPRR
jgi:hypothetical protein